MGIEWEQGKDVLQVWINACRKGPSCWGIVCAQVWASTKETPAEGQAETEGQRSLLPYRCWGRDPAPWGWSCVKSGRGDHSPSGLLQLELTRMVKQSRMNKVLFSTHMHWSKSQTLLLLRFLQCGLQISFKQVFPRNFIVGRDIAPTKVITITVSEISQLSLGLYWANPQRIWSLVQGGLLLLSPKL